MHRSQLVRCALVVGLWLFASDLSAAERTFNVGDFGAAADGKTDDTPAFQKCFAAVAASQGGNVIIPPGDYYFSGTESIPLASRTHVSAYGARFHLPRELSDQARIVLFAGMDIEDFSWFGGHFVGHCFDHRRASNTWEPNVCTRMIAIETSPEGRTARLTFRDVSSHRIAGAVIGVQGVPQEGSPSEIANFAEHVSLENCTLLESGKFMWDYGLLFQILVWPEDYTDADVAMAQKYFRNDLVNTGLKMADGDNRVFVANGTDELPITAADKLNDGICFFGDKLPANIVRGRLYYVVEQSPDFIRISEAAGGKPLKFDGAAGPQARLIRNVLSAFVGLYKPINAGPGKGAFDLVGCRHVTVRGCNLSALGDSMHIQRCHDVIFANNHITGSRMGAFFLAEYCKNATITGNTIDGTNGSRVMSVEKSSEDVTIVGNTFRGGGRGSWINQPKNLVLQGNIFINNTTKGEQDPWRGRRSWKTGTWETYPEMYFTLHQADGKYGPVVIRDNIFITGPEAAAAIHFERHGSDVLIDGNVFRGSTGKILVDPQTTVTFGENINAQPVKPSAGARFGNP